MPETEVDFDQEEQGEDSFEARRPDGHRRPHHRRRHHGGCIFAHILGVALLGAHFFFVRRFGQAQAAMNKLTGKKECKKQQKTVVFQQPQQPVVVEYAPVNHSTNSSLDDISEDKEMGMTYAPNPTGVQINQNTMV